MKSSSAWPEIRSRRASLSNDATRKAGMSGECGDDIIG